VSDRNKEIDAPPPTIALPEALENRGYLVPLQRGGALILATEDEIADILVTLSPDKRRRAIRRIKREIRHIRSSAELSHLHANVSIAVGGIGSAIGASGLLAIVAPAVAVTTGLVMVTIGGFLVAASGFIVSLFLGRNRIAKIEKAQHLEDLSEEIPNV
jgi:hypothetical protein